MKLYKKVITGATLVSALWSCSPMKTAEASSPKVKQNSKSEVGKMWPCNMSAETISHWIIYQTKKDNTILVAGNDDLGLPVQEGVGEYRKRSHIAISAPGTNSMARRYVDFVSTCLGF
jgi:hypothetical protein